jgi:hypothetical protein
LRTRSTPGGSSGAIFFRPNHDLGARIRQTEDRGRVFRPTLVAGIDRGAGRGRGAIDDREPDRKCPDIFTLNEPGQAITEHGDDDEARHAIDGPRPWRLGPAMPPVPARAAI